MIQARPEVLAIIPARGGSRGIPRKNLAPLGGKPLIAYSIESALQCRRINRVIVTTDDEEIAATSRALGAEVPFMRRADLAGERSLVLDAVMYTLRRLIQEQGYRPTHYAVLYPTSPFRTRSTMDRVVEAVLGRFLSAITVRGEWVSPLTYGRVHEGRYEPLQANVANTWVYSSAGATHAFTMAEFDAELNSRYTAAQVIEGWATQDPNLSHRQKLVEICDPAEAIDIDSPDDLMLAEEVLREGMFQR